MGLGKTIQSISFLVEMQVSWNDVCLKEFLAQDTFARSMMIQEQGRVSLNLCDLFAVLVGC